MGVLDSSPCLPHSPHPSNHLHSLNLPSEYFWAPFPPHHPGVGPHFLLLFLDHCECLLISFPVLSLGPHMLILFSYQFKCKLYNMTLRSLHKLAAGKFPITVFYTSLSHTFHSYFCTPTLLCSSRLPVLCLCNVLCLEILGHLSLLHTLTSTAQVRHHFLC